MKIKKVVVKLKQSPVFVFDGRWQSIFTSNETLKTLKEVFRLIFFQMDKILKIQRN